MSERRLMGWDPLTGKAIWWHTTADGWAIETEQYGVEDILDLNKEAANHCNPFNADKSVRMVARIPNIIAAKWRQELGIDIHSQDPDMQRKVDELLDSNEWKWLRTDTGRLT